MIHFLTVVFLNFEFNLTTPVNYNVVARMVGHKNITTDLRTKLRIHGELPIITYFRLLLTTTTAI